MDIGSTLLSPLLSLLHLFQPYQYNTLLFVLPQRCTSFSLWKAYPRTVPIVSLPHAIRSTSWFISSVFCITYSFGPDSLRVPSLSTLLPSLSPIFAALRHLLHLLRHVFLLRHHHWTCSLFLALSSYYRNVVSTSDCSRPLIKKNHRLSFDNR